LEYWDRRVQLEAGQWCDHKMCCRHIMEPIQQVGGLQNSIIFEVSNVLSTMLEVRHET